jgi:hypothetical protein
MKHTTNFRLSTQAFAALSLLAKKLNISKTDIVEHAISEYCTLHTSHPLLKFAGDLSNNDSAEMIDIIYSSRKNKTIPTDYK